MINKWLSVAAIATMAFATSCSNDDFDSPQNGSEAVVSLTAQLPEGLQSRAFGNGTTANTLSYAVYMQNGEGWTLTNTIKDNEAINMSKTINLRLTNGKTYQIVFWADADESIYTTNWNDRKIEANYDGVVSSNEKLDAFFAVETITVNGASSNNVELTRPFAQLNIGTNDLAASANAGCSVSQASVTVKTFNTLNFDGNVLGEETVTFGLANLPGTSETFPVDGYDYLAMNYVLMPASKEIRDVTIAYDNEGVPARTFANVPLQRNYRTNIYGALLTSMNDFNVTINPDFEDPDYNITAWDGTSMTEPEMDEAGVYQVKSANEWAWLTQNNTSGKGIKLLNDLDFGGNYVGAMPWLSTFDGNGKTISNLTISIDKSLSGVGGQASIGLFKDCIGVADAWIKNLTVENIKIDSDSKAHVFGALLGAANFNPSTTLTIDNVTVANADIQGVSKVGGLIGMISVCNKVVVSNTTVKDSYIHNYSVAKESGYVCGLVGAVQNKLEIGNNVQLVNNTILGIYAGDAYNRPASSINAVAATRGTGGQITGSANVTGGSCTANVIADVTISTAAELKAFADAVNAGNSYDNQVVVLGADIDLGGAEWKPIGQTSYNTTPATYFLGTFDGGNHTISNFKITHYETSPDGTYASGFFGFVDAGTANIVNLNLDKVTIEGHHWCGAVVGYLSEGTISNCTVTNATIECSHLDNKACGDKAGVITGYANSGTVRNCLAKDSSVKAGRDAGQIIGCAREEQVVNCEAVNVTVSILSGCTGANVREDLIGRVQ